jgi:hypothetical protein
MVVTNFIGFLPKSPGDWSIPAGEASPKQVFIDKKQLRLFC